MLSRAARGSLHLAAQGAARLGNRAAVRRQVRDLRLVRRVLGLSSASCRDTERRRAERDSAGHRALHRQGHPENAHRLLARDADDCGSAAISPSQRARLAELRRLADVEELGQHSRPDGIRAQVRHRRAALLRDARDRLRPRCRFQRRAAHRALQLRPREQSRQPREPGAADGAKLLRRRGESRAGRAR